MGRQKLGVVSLGVSITQEQADWLRKLADDRMTTVSMLQRQFLGFLMELEEIHGDRIDYVLADMIREARRDSSAETSGVVEPDDTEAPNA